MRADIHHSPSFALARLELSGGEQVRVEAGAMPAHSKGHQLEAKMEGGLMKSLKRSMLGGESMFVSTFTAPSEGGWLDENTRLDAGGVYQKAGGGRCALHTACLS